MYLSVVMDLCSRRIVGWSMRDDMRSEIVVDALEMAWFRRSPGKDGKAVSAIHPRRARQTSVLEGQETSPQKPSAAGAA